MSTRAALYVGEGKKAKVLAEATRWVPLCWLALPSADDVARGAATGCVVTDRQDALDRSVGGTAFLADLFPEFPSFAECADSLRAVLKQSRAATVSLALHDHFAIAEDRFPLLLASAVKAIEERDAGRTLALPARRIQHPLTGKSMTIKAETLKLREVICRAAAIDPTTDDDDLARDQLIGCLL